MRGLVVTTGKADSAQLVDNLPDPDPADGQVLVQGLAVGVCATDREIVAGTHGAAPPGTGDLLVLGHESLGRVVSDPTGTFEPGDLVAGIVRRPDPVPCESCAVGEWDMCRNGQFLECGIAGRHGFARDRWRIEPDFAIRLDPLLGGCGVLLEPASVVTKAWDHIERIGHRTHWRPKTVLVTGAGPVGLLAALLGTQRGLEVHVLDQVTEGVKPELVGRLGAVYHAGAARSVGFGPDIVLECTGADQVIVDVLDVARAGCITALVGVPADGSAVTVDIGRAVRNLVLENNVAFGSVNANRQHWQAAAASLAMADPEWLGALITRRLPLTRFAEALTPDPNDVKVVLDLTS